jgi:hypothetical protein
MPVPLADMEIASRIFREVWCKLDHSQHYCLNPLILAVELLEVAGIGQYPHVRRIIGEKGKRYRDLTSMMVLHIPVELSLEPIPLEACS